MLKKNKSDQDILDLPRMVDGDHLAVARLLNLLFNYANHASPKLSALICFRNVQLTVGALCVFRRVSESLCVCAEK